MSSLRQKSPSGGKPHQAHAQIWHTKRLYVSKGDVALVLFKEKIHFPTTKSCLLQGRKLHNKLLSGWEQGISGFLVTALPSLLDQAGCFGLNSAALVCPSLFPPHLLFLCLFWWLCFNAPCCLLAVFLARLVSGTATWQLVGSCPVTGAFLHHQVSESRHETGWWNTLNAQPAVDASVSEKPKAGSSSKHSCGFQRCLHFN